VSHDLSSVSQHVADNTAVHHQLPCLINAFLALQAHEKLRVGGRLAGLLKIEERLPCGRGQPIEQALEEFFIGRSMFFGHILLHFVVVHFSVLHASSVNLSLAGGALTLARAEKTGSRK